MKQSGMSPVDRVVMRPASDADERLKAALCSTTDDLYPDGNGRVLVSGTLPNGEKIYLGEVDENALCQKGVDPMALIDRVRFGA